MRLFAAVLLATLVAACSNDEGLLADVDSSDVVGAGRSTDQFAGAKKFSGDMATYRVTIVNMTHSQPFSPGVVVTHDASVRLFGVGSPASEGIRQIAENGNQATAFAALNGAPGVEDVVDTGGPIFTRNGPGSNEFSATVVAGEETKYLSMAVMLICTNDGFVGLDSVELPRGPRTEVYFPNAYDAGTEANDELYTSIVDACGAIGPVAVDPDGMNNRTPTSENVSHHPGISGVGDLDVKTYSWRNKVARVTVKRIG